MDRKGLLVSMAVVSLLGVSGVAQAAQAPVPEAVRAGIAAGIREWIEQQAEGSKNEFGKPTKRGYFSRDYTGGAGGTYSATAHIETAGADTKTTERYLLELSPKGKEYEVVNAHVQDTYAGLFRETHTHCYSFSAFKFEREGIELAAKDGEVCTDFFQGRVSDFRVHGADMTYRYAPPPYANKLHLNRDYHAIFKTIEQDHERELFFPPAAFLFNCDPDTCDELLQAHFTGLQRGESDGVAPTDAGARWRASTWDAPLVNDTLNERKDSPFAHFRRPYQAGNKSWAVFVLRDVAPFTYPGAEEGFVDVSNSLPGAGVVLAYDNWEGYEVSFYVFPRRLDIPEQLLFRIYGYYSEQTLAQTDPYELERREDAEQRWHQAYSVKGRVDMGLEDPEMLVADMDFGIELKQPLRELPFAIQSIPQQEFTGKNKPRVLYVNSVQLDGEELTWTRTSQLGGLIVFPETLPAGTKLNLHMNFATRAMYKVTPSFTYVSRFGWMPFVRFGDFIDDFELTIRTPSDYKVLGIGRKATEKLEGSYMVTQWKADSPVVFPSITFGRYHEDGPGENFQAKKADGTVIPVTVHVDKASFEDWGIPPKALRPIAQQAVNSINLYREISGVDYPYGELNFVNDPFGLLYGQAPSSLIYLGSGVFRGEGFLASLPIPWDATGIAKFLKSVTAHEVGHQWWGSRVSNANDRNYWFVETLAEYFSALYLEAVHGEQEYREQVEEWRRTIVDRRIKSTVQASYSVWGGEDGFGSIQANIYNKGPYAFHMLREIFKGQGPSGPQGADQKFFAFLKQFSQKLTEQREIVTFDIQNAAQEALGGVNADGTRYNADLGWFFDQWIRGTGIPQYRLTYDVRQTEDGKWLIEGLIQQRVVVGSSRSHQVLDGTYYRGLVNVFVLAGGKEYGPERVVVQGPETRFQLKVPQKPVEVALNKHGETLTHDTLVNQAWD